MVRAQTVFDIRQGIRLGHDVFIVSENYVQQLSKPERRFFRPAVMNPSISDARLTRAYYAFYPYSAGLPPITTEEELAEHVPRYFKEYLLPAKKALKARKTLERQTELKWWDLLWPRIWQKETNPKMVSKYFGGSRSFAFDDAGDFVVVVGNGWLLKKVDVELAITDEEVYTATAREVYLAMLAYLSSSVAYDLLEYVSIPVSGGQLDLSNKYVGQLPIPRLSSFSLTSVTALTQMGAKIMDGYNNWKDVDGLVLSTLAR